MSDGARAVAGVLCLLVLVCVPVAAQSTPQTGIGEVSISGGGVISAEVENGSTYLWQGEPVNVSVTFADYSDVRNYQVCLGYEREGAPAKQFVPCEPLALSDGTNGTAAFSNVTWPANVTGERELVVELQGLSNENNATALDRETVPVTVLRKEGDFDGDGLTNAEEASEGYNLSNSDMDSDGLSDGEEVNQYSSNPQNPDTDDDGIRDGVEIRQATNPSTPDTDGDGLPDRTEMALLGTDPTNDLTPAFLVVIVLIVIGVLAAVFVVLRRGWRERFGGAVVASDGDGETEAAEVREDPEPTTEPAPAPEPLTDEDRVLGLLRDHGGRMKQSHIVAETEWSKAKVSRLLSAMNEEGTIEKLSIGRENIISLDGQGPEAAGSPHEENATD